MQAACVHAPAPQQILDKRAARAVGRRRRERPEVRALPTRPSSGWPERRLDQQPPEPEPVGAPVDGHLNRPKPCRRGGSGVPATRRRRVSTMSAADDIERMPRPTKALRIAARYCSPRQPLVRDEEAGGHLREVIRRDAGGAHGANQQAAGVDAADGQRVRARRLAPRPFRPATRATPP